MWLIPFEAEAREDEDTAVGPATAAQERSTAEPILVLVASIGPERQLRECASTHPAPAASSRPYAFLCS